MMKWKLFKYHMGSNLLRTIHSGSGIKHQSRNKCFHTLSRFRYSMFNRVSCKSFFTKTRLLLKKDYYKILGLSHNASQDDIKKAYFKLAKEWHPDRSKAANAKEKFAEISEAYDTLGDAQKRQSYDQFGITGDEQDQFKQYQNMGGAGGGFGGFGNFGGFSGSPFGSGSGEKLEDIFEEMDEFFNQGAKGGNGKKTNKKGKDIVVNLEINFMDAINGAQKQVNFERISVCSSCNGSRCKPGSSPTTCSTCNGSGKVFYKQGFMSIAMECNSCHGEGTTIRNPCMTCYGKGHTNVQTKETINIPRGVDDGMNLRVSKKGHYSASGNTGDLYVKVKIKPHAYFKRDQFDIYTTNYINISQAVLGAKVKVKTLYGDIMMSVEPGTQDGDQKVFANYGVPKLPPNQNTKGSHYVKIKLKIPTKLNPATKQLFEELAKYEDKVETD